MVKLFHTIAAMAAVVASVAAAPFGGNPMRSFSAHMGPNECVPETTVREYHPFQLKSSKLGSMVSKMIDDMLLVGGVQGDKNFEQLTMCIVSSDSECMSGMPSNCIYQNVEYRFRVQGPMEGYLRVGGPVIEIVPSWYEASPLTLYKEEGWGLRISQGFGDYRRVFATNGAGNPISMEPFRANDARQWFQIMEPSYDAQVGPNECIPGADVKEYHPFLLRNYALGSMISKKIQSNLVVGGIPGNKDFEQLVMCVVSSELPCTPGMPSHCIYENVEYRYRVEGPMKGYLRVQGQEVVIVPDFHMASPMTLFREAGLQLRVAYGLGPSRLVMATTVPGGPVHFEPFVLNNQKQWFNIMPPHFQAREEPGECIPEVDLKEYHTFLLKSSKLGSIVSRTKDDMLVGGDPENKSLDELELCIVSTDYGCDNHIPSGCIYPNVEYRFRVNNPVKGYLKTDGYIVEIVDDFNKATGMNLYKEKGWGLRIAHFEYGSPRVFATNGKGEPISMEKPKQNDARQWFQIMNTGLW